ncbi:hypothetical protein E2C01_025774 [Portunus trituberculatus]|uniref:Uncharacterized protein n=1 Tax=Portunus trituberculatus TaxID=210409 RepID=A0A5B7EHD7_PORTR|nr:hypothetical protein [Portunus trituberculatus]
MDAETGWLKDDGRMTGRVLQKRKEKERGGREGEGVSMYSRRKWTIIVAVLSRLPSTPFQPSLVEVRLTYTPQHKQGSGPALPTLFLADPSPSAAVESEHIESHVTSSNSGNVKLSARRLVMSRLLPSFRPSVWRRDAQHVHN